MIRTQLALLSNLLGGYDKLAKAMDVPARHIESYITATELSKSGRRMIDRQYNDLLLNESFWSRIDRGYELQGTPYDSMRDYLDDLEDTILEWDSSRSMLTNFDERLRGKFLNAVADGQIDLEDIQIDPTLNKAPIDFFAELTPRQTQLMIEWLDEDSSHTFKGAIEGYYDDEGDIYRDVETSRFWAWYRDTFY